jgi:hypothetical protein
MNVPTPFFTARNLTIYGRRGVWDLYYFHTEADAATFQSVGGGYTSEINMVTWRVVVPRSGTPHDPLLPAASEARQTSVASQSDHLATVLRDAAKRLTATVSPGGIKPIHCDVLRQREHEALAIFLTIYPLAVRGPGPTPSDLEATAYGIENGLYWE